MVEGHRSNRGLIKAYPDSERARSMRQRLYIKKEEMKKTLLSAWDDAVKRQDTDRSLEILKDLDMYLTHNGGPGPSRGRQGRVPKTSSITWVCGFPSPYPTGTGRRPWTWGSRSSTEFPNSRMSEEIRGQTGHPETERPTRCLNPSFFHLMNEGMSEDRQRGVL